MTHAISLVAPTREVVSLAPGTYTTSVAVTNKTVFIHGTGATWNAPSTGFAISVGDAAQVHLAGISFQDANVGGGHETLDCEPSTSGGALGTLDLDQVSIDASDYAVYGNPCSVTITRSRIHERTAGTPPLLLTGLASTLSVDRSTFDGGDGLQILAQASAQITNSVISNQTGTDGAFIGGSLLGSPVGSITVSFSTVINSLVKCSSGTPRCAGGSAAGACIDNSIIYNSGGAAPDTVSGSACVESYSIVYPQSSALNGSNNKTVPPQFADFANGDYRLSSTSPALNAADPAATNAHDFDGISRPQGPRSDMGAFEYH